MLKDLSKSKPLDKMNLDGHPLKASAVMTLENMHEYGITIDPNYPLIVQTREQLNDDF